MTFRRALLVGALSSLAICSLASAQAPKPNMVHVRFNLAPPAGLREPIPIVAQVYRVERDSFGQYKLTGSTQSVVEMLTPGVREKIQLETDIELGDDVEYEFRLVVLDDEGRERSDGAYLFVRPTEAGELLDESVPLRPGIVNDVPLTLRWVEAPAQAKSNFLKVDQQAGQSDYVLALYVIDSTNIKLFN